MVNDSLATRPLPAPHRPGVRALGALVMAESKMVIRDTAGLVVPLGLPILILVMNGLSIQDATFADGRSVMDSYVLPVVAAVVMATIGVINMPSFLALYRKGLVLARLEMTPVSPALVLVAQVIVSALQTVVGIAIALVTATMFFDASLPQAPWLTLGVFALVAAAMYAVGMMVAAISPTPNSAVAIGLVAFFGMAAIGGMFGPPENLPDALAQVGSVLPFGAGVEALSAAWNGQVPPTATLLSLAVAVVVPSAIAARWFRWS